MYHGTTSRRARIIGQSISVKRKERLRKEREKLIESLKGEKTMPGFGHDPDSVWDAALDRAIEIVRRELR
jgi:hypothetical protein